MHADALCPLPLSLKLGAWDVRLCLLQRSPVSSRSKYDSASANNPNVLVVRVAVVVVAVVEVNVEVEVAVVAVVAVAVVEVEVHVPHEFGQLSRIDSQVSQCVAKIAPHQVGSIAHAGGSRAVGPCSAAELKLQSSPANVSASTTGRSSAIKKYSVRPSVSCCSTLSSLVAGPPTGKMVHASCW